MASLCRYDERSDCGLAEEYGATLVKLDDALNQAGKNLGYEAITGADGVHPTSLGHAFIADQWLRHTGL